MFERRKAKHPLGGKLALAAAGSPMTISNPVRVVRAWCEVETSEKRKILEASVSLR